MIKTLTSARRASRIVLIALELLPYFRRIIAAADRISGLSSAERRNLVIGCAQSVEAQLDSIARDDAEQQAGERISGELDEITPDSSRVAGTFAWPTGKSSPSSSPSSGGIES